MDDSPLDSPYLIHWDGDQTRDKGWLVGERVGSDIEHVTREAGLGSVVEHKSDAVAGVRSHSPVLLVVACERKLDQAYVSGMIWSAYRRSHHAVCLHHHARSPGFG